MDDPLPVSTEATNVSNPLEELKSLEQQVAEEINLMSEADREIELLTRRLSQLRSQKDALREQNRENKRRIGSLERAAAIYEAEKIVDEKIKIVQDELFALVDKVDWPEPPKEYQKKGAAKLAVAERGICTDKRGLGKTLTAFLWRRMVKSRKTLIMTTNKLINQMEKELRYWDNHHTVVNLAGLNSLERATVYPLIAMAPDVIVILNYEAWRRDRKVIDHLLSVGFDAAIFDEIHNAKESRAVLSQGLLRLSAIPRLIEMTGTLILNRPQEAWFPLHILYPNIFPDKPSFLRDYCINFGANDWRWRTGGEEALARKLQGFLVSRTRDDVGIEVPPPAIIEYPITMDDYPEQRKAYELVSERAMAILSSGKQFSLPSVLSILSRSRQMAVWPAGIEFMDECVCEDPEFCICNPKKWRFDVYESAVLDFATDLVKELVTEEEERVILFSNFKEPVFEMQRRLAKAGLSVVTLTGETSKWQANVIEDDFDLKTAPKNPKYQVLLATYKTVGEGLNLNAARHGILLDSEWNPGREDQAIGRIDRMNSVDQATIHKPLVDKTVYLFMKKLMERKRDIIGGFDNAVDLQNAMLEAIANGEM